VAIVNKNVLTSGIEGYNMNERIKELMLEAGYAAPELASRANKLAELIVRECARIVPDTDLGDVDGGDSAVLRAASKQIREHFGVE
jgi:hypothetical protein